MTKTELSAKTESTQSAEKEGVEPIPFDVHLVSKSFVRSLSEQKCSPSQMISAANLLLDQALEMLRANRT